MVITSSANSIAFIVAFFFLLHPSHSSLSSSSSSTGLVVVVAEEKARLGSTPPSCQNRCNMCHPCMAVQVPTTPSRGRAEPTEDQNRYSNYKPLGWKCRCRDHFYNP